MSSLRSIAPGSASVGSGAAFETSRRAAVLRILRKPGIWLALVFLLFLLAVADSFRAPPRQVSVKVFASAVSGYHTWLHPVTSHFIRCRYEPTCSRYAVEAVRRYGIVKGLALSFRRIRSCRRSVPMGTRDPVP